MDTYHFLHGDEYVNHTGKVRSVACDTCAFKQNSPMRPADFNLSEFMELCADLTDFVCHTKNNDGSNPSCAAWHAIFS